MSLPAGLWQPVPTRGRNRFRQPIGHRQQVCRVATSDLEHAAALDRRGRHSKERRDGREPTGMAAESSQDCERRAAPESDAIVRRGMRCDRRHVARRAGGGREAAANVGAHYTSSVGVREIACNAQRRGVDRVRTPFGTGRRVDNAGSRTENGATVQSCAGELRRSRVRIFQNSTNLRASRSRPTCPAARSRPHSNQQREGSHAHAEDRRLRARRRSRRRRGHPADRGGSRRRLAIASTICSAS